MKTGYGVFVKGVMIDWFAYKSAAIESAKEFAKDNPQCSVLVKKAAPVRKGKEANTDGRA